MPVPMDPTGPKPPPLGPKDCNSQECIKARASVVDAGNVIMLKCGQMESARSKRDVFAAVAAVLATLAVALFAAAAVATVSILGIPLAPVLFWAGVTVAATSIVFWTLAGIFEAQRLVIEGELGAAKNNFISATSAVVVACPTTCWGDLTIPKC